MPVGAAGIVPAGAARIGAMSSSARIGIDVVLQPRNAAALSQYATQVSTPGTALYHRYITAKQFPALFGPTQATIASVLAALRAQGLQPGAVSSDHLSISVTATASQLESALGTTLASYRLAGGRTGFANTSAPRIPASIAPAVQAIIGLDNLTQMHNFMARPSSARLTKAVSPAQTPTGGPQACGAAAGLQGEGALTANDLAFDYDFSPLYGANDFGAGQTVGIVEFGEPNLKSDVTGYQNCYGTNAKVSYDKVDGFNQHGAGEGEAALDIDTVIGLAPKANIIVYDAPNTGKAAYDIYRTMVGQDKARVISESYGLCDHFQDAKAAGAVTVLYEQAAVQGQSIVASSGDAGSEACLPNNDGKILSTNFPASDPLVLGVGGTEVVNSVERPGEVVWNERNIQEGAGGGGKSTLFNMPQYQTSFLKVKKGVREVPDVSADADPQTGYTVFHQGSWTVIGGTSAAAPLWAALLTLVNGQCSASPMGWVNPLLYFVASPQVKTVVLDDITPHGGFINNNDYTNGHHGTYKVTKGFDMATGLGSPIGGPLATELCHFNPEPTGYWMTSSSGQIFAFNAPFQGSLSGKHLASKVVGIAGVPQSKGYYLVTSKGAVSAFAAPFHGSVAHPSSPVVGIAADKAGTGYWVVTSNGHVYSFNAKFRGQVKHPSSKVVGIALDPQTGGYWIASSNGHVYAFGAGKYKGKKLTGITGITASSKKQGYWLVNSSGRVFGFNVNSEGSMPFNEGKVIGIAGDSTFGGYWLATATGHVGAIGADWHGDHAGSKTAIVGIAGS
jgi:subtilase family serine protease